MVTDIRGNTTTTWTEYGSGAERIRNQQLPTSPLPATARIVDGFTMSSRDTVGIQTSASRRYTTEGLELKQTDGRGNTTTTQSDLLGRTIRVTDAAGNTTKTRYQLDNTQPSLVVNALGYSTFSKYDLRNRKIAEYGTGAQPATFGYDDADNLTRLTTYRAAGKVISTDPSGLEGDTTTWEYDLATGLELRKTYADGKGTVKTYDAYNNLSTVTDARGVVATYSYDIPRGLLTGINFSDGTPAQKGTYNFLGQVVSVQDASGERSISYDHYGETNEEVQPIAGTSYALQEHWDAYGRSMGYALLKDGALQCEASTTYGTLGRIQSAGFTHEGTVHQFRYGYLAGSNLLQSLTMPNGVTLTQSYEEKRDLLTGMDYVRDNSLVTQREYNYDALGRPTTRDTRYPDKAVHHADSFSYDKRSQLIGALLGEDAYAYSYDNIGNREIAQEAAEDITYDANDLNQYTRISTNGEDFTPEYDADGNQTLVQTTTGIWHVTYNGQNRAIKFEGEDGRTTITCGYDYMGRRFEKKVTVDGAVTLHERYIYRGYLQITALDMLHDASLIHSITWDPTQEIATRPLAIQKEGTWYTYGWDLTKNICELYGQEGFIRTIYTYSPYGQVTAEGDVQQPIQWSSEYHDEELQLVYYNYRYYNPLDGRWTRRDPEDIRASLNLYLMVHNDTISNHDNLGQCEGKGCSGECAQKCGGANRCQKEGNDCKKRTAESTGELPTTNGCGSNIFQHFGIDLLTALFSGRDFNSLCNEHDRCYGTCNASQDACDLKLKDDIYNACVSTATWDSLRLILLGLLASASSMGIATGYFFASSMLGLFFPEQKCGFVAETFYRVLSKYGEKHFEEAQDKACKWEPCCGNNDEE